MSSGLLDIFRFWTCYFFLPSRKNKIITIASIVDFDILVCKYTKSADFFGVPYINDELRKV